MRLLLVEDNKNLAAAVVEMLSLDGHAVDHAEDISSAWHFARSTPYDLILLDIMLPDGDGRSFLRELRNAMSDVPVIVLTARSEVSDRVSVLDLGADDYLVKPFDFAELEARCRAIIRRRGGTASNLRRIGNAEFDIGAGTLRIGAKEIALRNRELRLFEVFSANPNIILSKTRLLEAIFSAEEDVSQNAIEVYVGRLRKHLRGADLEIATVRGLGYRMIVH
ncbi:response regulator transcription factor [Roseobacteraceae bacterium S113]